MVKLIGRVDLTYNNFTASDTSYETGQNVLKQTKFTF